MSRTTTRRIATAVSMLAAAHVAQGCAPKVTTSSEPEPPTSTGAPTVQSSTTVAPSELPANRVVWQVDSGGGFVPYASVANDVPEVTVYGDGRVFLAQDDQATDAPVGPVPPPIQMMSGEIASDDLGDFLDEVAASDAIDESVDYGDPQVTDLPGTTVRFDPAGEASEINVYALGDGFDEGLTDAQRQARRSLTELIDESRRLVGDTTPWVPDRVEAIDIAPQATPDPSADTAPWPGPPFIELFGTIKPGNPEVGPRCAEITGDSASKVFDAALESGVPFVDGKGDVRQVVVAALLPGEEACTGV